MGSRSSLNLNCEIVEPTDLSESQINQMYDLMVKNYTGMNLFYFQADLKEKTKILLFYNDQSIEGFTSLKINTMELDNQTIQIAYSGDTVLAKEFRGSLAIPIYWGKFMLKVSEGKYPLYWLLTSKGFRTYRYLSVFFKDFFPKPEGSYEDLKLLRNLISIQNFGDDFDPTKGILKRKTNIQTIIEIESDKKAIENSKDPYIKFFASANPNYVLGEELVCIAKFSKDNILPFIYRYLTSNNEHP
ncbi:hypothetical protein EHR01_03990 [Leptospira mtsangambouensis]|uniref:Uncharacterized protein n=1 Tax=Leptospira mtsangambouensis TaxID=2484912 RepID=A0ABY2P4C5_9LEPT|nr:hypothetical protein [Leptospira mtsangambouensis]TGM81957.1 hypothetical protein EHR01_03990 [Leptospira mtsangambouensis]